MGFDHWLWVHMNRKRCILSFIELRERMPVDLKELEEMGQLSNVSWLSRVSGIHRNVLQRLVTGVSQPTLRTVYRLGESLGLNQTESVELVERIRRIKAGSRDA